MYKMKLNKYIKLRNIYKKWRKKNIKSKPEITIRTSKHKKPHKFHLTIPQLNQKQSLLIQRLSQPLSKNQRKRLKYQLSKVKQALQHPQYYVVDVQAQKEKKIQDQLKRIKKKIEMSQKQKPRTNKRCFQCNGHHLLAQCKQKIIDILCFRCGSKQHQLDKCKQEGPLKFASCFVCNEQGHLSRDCEKNQKGIYKMGGECWNCGSNRHLRANCPQKNGQFFKESQQQY